MRISRLSLTVNANLNRFSGTSLNIGFCSLVPEQKSGHQACVPDLQ